MTTNYVEGVQITISARQAALAWLNAFAASSKEESRPLLCRTLSVEIFEDRGVQFVATNGHILFRTWVSSGQGKGWPPIATRPELQLTVMDTDGFGVGFMRALLRVTGEENHAGEQITITASDGDDDVAPSFGQEFQTKRVTLRAVGQRLDLLVRDEAYPDWRKLKLGLDDLALVDGMKVSPKYLGLIGKLKDISGVDLTFAGADRAIFIAADGIEGAGVQGLLMPMRRLETREGEEE